MRPTDNQIQDFFIKTIEKKYDSNGFEATRKLCDSYQDLLLFECIMRPHYRQGENDSFYEILTDSLYNHESASIIRFENGGIPIYQVKGSENPVLGFGMLLIHKLIKKDVNHFEIINKCIEQISQKPVDIDDPFDESYREFIKIVSNECQFPLKENNDSFLKTIPTVASFIKDEETLELFDIFYVCTLSYLYLRQAKYLIDYLFFWSCNIEFWLNKKVKRANAINISSLLLQVYQNHY